MHYLRQIYHLRITYEYAGSGRFGWSVQALWQTQAFAEPGLVDGELHTRHPEPDLTTALETVLATARQGGIVPAAGIPGLPGVTVFGPNIPAMDATIDPRWPDQVRAVLAAYGWMPFFCPETDRADVE